MLPDLSNNFGEYNVIIMDMHHPNTQGAINWHHLLKGGFSPALSRWESISLLWALGVAGVREMMSMVIISCEWHHFKWERWKCCKWHIFRVLFQFSFSLCVNKHVCVCDDVAVQLCLGVSAGSHLIWAKLHTLKGTAAVNTQTTITHSAVIC